MIKIQNISKSYGATKALISLSLCIKKGEFYSLLGPNGAGKTTIINLVGGLFPPDSGKILIDGKPIEKHSKKVKNRLGIVPQEVALYEELTVHENLQSWAKINGMAKTGLNNKIDETLRFLGLEEHALQPLSKFSGGMKRRINIAAALLHNPDILFFDEPTVGIDPQSRFFIYSIFKQLRNQGKTILYTSHYLEEVEMLSDRIGIIDYGELVAEGTFEELREKTGLRESIHFYYQPIDEEKLKVLASSPLMHSSFSLNGSLEREKCVFIGNKPSEDLSQLVQLFANHHIDLETIEIKPVGLEQVYMYFTKTALRDCLCGK